MLHTGRHTDTTQSPTHQHQQNTHHLHTVTPTDSPTQHTQSPLTHNTHRVTDIARKIATPVAVGRAHRRTAGRFR